MSLTSSRESALALSTRALVTGCIVATIAFAAYSRTLLPGVDLGDTGGFQAAVVWPQVSARQAYPLYYTLAKPFVSALSPDNPARGLNLFSAVWAALACGVLTGVVAMVTGSTSGGAVAGLLLAFSYTFWTQAVIAEVYSLHLALVGLCLIALIGWWRTRSLAWLVLFFAIYATAFGNHLSMILLLVPFGAFLLMTAKQPSDMLRPRIIGLALAIAIAGALQYTPQFLAVWNAIDAPDRAIDRLSAFWFDVTKSDWRESMVMGVRSDELRDRLAMFVFDARQQFGFAGLALAMAGVAVLWRISRPWATLVIVAYAINTAFAASYNVGDPHVFFLPGHYFVAFAAGAAVAGAMRAPRRWRSLAAAGAAAVIGYAGWRGYDAWPAVDRHADRRAEQLVTRMTAGLDERRDLLATQLNWQVENALLYESRYHLRQVVWIRLADVMLHFPLLVRDNHEIGRDVVLTAAAASEVSAAFGTLLPTSLDAVPSGPSLASYVSGIRSGSLYALTLLTPPRDEALDENQLEAALAALTGGRVMKRSGAPYEVLVGRAGEAPLFHRSAARPFRQQMTIPEGALDIRMDGWVPLETFRRGGFGHVILNRVPSLTVERGVSLVAFGADEPFYAAGLYALRPRFRISAEIPRLALLH